MTQAAAATGAAAVRPVLLDGGGCVLSGLLSLPAQPVPRATVVALHGGGMTAAYFDGQAHPDVSLLDLGARLGYAVLALDRPGYGVSAARLPAGQRLTEQAATVAAAIADHRRQHAVGAGVLVVAHSFGAKVALTMAAAAWPDALLGLDVSGCGHVYAVDPRSVGDAAGPAGWSRNWGPLALYPPGTFRASAGAVAPMPERERRDASRWPAVFADVAARVTAPVRLTFAEHEAWWRHDDATLTELASRFTATTPRVEHQPGAGHNISLGWAARSYHLRALAFAEERIADLARGTPAR